MSDSRQLTGLESARQVGFVLPHLDVLTEPLLARTIFPQVEFHTSRMRRTGPLGLASLAAMNEEADSAADRLPLPFLDLVVYHCTSGSALGGSELEQRLAARTGRPAFATTSAILGALRTIRARRLCLVTPYVSELALSERRILEAAGFLVVAEGGRPVSDGIAMQHVAPDEIGHWVLKAADTASNEIDAVFIACTGLRSPECVDGLERVLGVPVVTSTTAMVSWLFRCLGIPYRHTGYGSWLTRPAV